MNGLGPQARRLLELGEDAGEPDDASLARARAALLRRVGASAVAMAVTTTATTGAASTTSATSVAVAAAKAAPLSTAAVAPTATMAAKLAAVPLVVKVVATAVLAVGVGAGTLAYRADSPARDAAPLPAQTRLVSSVPRSRLPSPLGSTRRSTREDDAPTAPQAPVDPIADSKGAPTKVPEVARAAGERTHARVDVAAVVHAPSPSSVASAILVSDVENLRQAQAALVSGRPEEALAAAERVTASGPLADEREGVRVLAACALGAPGARRQAEDFVQRRPQAPLAVRVRAACLGQE